MTTVSRVSGPWDLLCNSHTGKNMDVCRNCYWRVWLLKEVPRTDRQMLGSGRGATDLVQQGSRKCWRCRPRSQHCRWTVHCPRQRLRGSWGGQFRSGRLSGSQWNFRFGSLLCTMSLWEMGIQRCGTPRWQIHLLWQSHFLSPEKRRKRKYYCAHIH